MQQVNKPHFLLIRMVYLVLHPHGISLAFKKLDSWSPGTGFIPILSTKEINHIKKGNCKKKFYA